MSTIAVTGSSGFLGLHVRAAAHASGIRTVAIRLGDEFNEESAGEALVGVTSVVHLAGVNRGADSEVAAGNKLFAEQLIRALRRSKSIPQTIVYANSIQAGNGTVYGEAKLSTAESLQRYSKEIGTEFVDIMLPNLFGEYGRPNYNSVVATFSHLVATGQAPVVHHDAKLTLLHAQNAAEVLIGAIPIRDMAGLSHTATVSGVKGTLEEFRDLYSDGEIPDISTPFRRDLFNTYRSYLFPSSAPISIERHADYRGAFFEVLRSHGGTGQTSFSVTEPGITRGDHYHRRKIERFTVLSGRAEISLRRLFDDRVYRFSVSGTSPVNIDMPTLYTHNIRNTGSGSLYTAFWTNDLFDPENADTVGVHV